MTSYKKQITDALMALEVLFSLLRLSWNHESSFSYKYFFLRSYGEGSSSAFVGCKCVALFEKISRHLSCRKMFSMIKMRWKQRWGVEFTRQVSRLASRNPSEPTLRRLINRFGGSWNVWKAKNVAATWDFQQSVFNFWKRPCWHSGLFWSGWNHLALN